MGRNKAIVRASFVGIGANLFLALFKLAAGLAANSVSILTDAINNFADMMSSLITIIGTRLSEKEPDRRHPFGYGRIEYLASLLIGMIIVYAGIDALRRAVYRILHPEESEFSALTLLIIGMAVLVKILIGIYTKKRGKALDSKALTASGIDALSDAAVSASTLAAALVFLVAGVNIEAWVGAAISLLIMKTGVDTLRETVGSLLGERTDAKLTRDVQNAIRSFPEIDGVYDIVIHSYGKDRLLGSTHVEISDQFTVAWVDNLQRAVTRKVLEETGVELLGLSVYARNTQSPEVMDARKVLQSIVDGTEGASQLHGFYIDFVDKTMSFEAVLEFGSRSRKSLLEELKEKVLAAFPEYDIAIAVEYDFAE